MDSKALNYLFFSLLILNFAFLGTGCSPKFDLSLKDQTSVQIDSIVSAWINSDRIPGAVLHITKDGKPIHHKAYGASQLYEYGTGQYPIEFSQLSEEETKGISRIDPPKLMSTQTIFDLASVTKVMATTMAVMLLVDRGELDIEARVSKYLPEFTGGGKERITLQHLLTHRSGLLQWVPTYYHASNSAEVFQYICSLPLQWPIGESRHYSDLGFMLLGFVVEQVSGQNLDKYLKENLYSTLRLTSTGFRPISNPNQPIEKRTNPYAATSHGNPFEYRMVHDTTFGYHIDGDPNSWSYWRKRTLIGEVNDGNTFHAFKGVAGHAGLFSTAEDLGTVLSMLLNKGIFDNKQILSSETINLFLQTTGDEQALGWQVSEYVPVSGFFHNGFTGTFVMGVRSQNIGVVLLTNKQNIGVDENTRYTNLAELQKELIGVLIK